MGTVQNDPKVYTNFSGFPEKSEALDNNLHTLYQSDAQRDMLWFLRLNSAYEIKWILVSIRGGSYELHITTTATSIVNGATLCKEFSLSGIRQHQTAIECNRAMLGDTIIIKKTDEGSLRLFEIYPIVCPPNHYGPSCARCRKKCQSCDSITGICTQCPPSFYGQECQYSCPQHCLGLICDQTTGICNGCQYGFKGLRCELRTQTNTPFLYCHHSCVTCNRDLQVCMICFQRLETDICRYTCREICSGESACLGYQENCSRQDNDKKGSNSSETYLPIIVILFHFD
uniref:Scavenger receptor class F member 2-like n=1 Tax=Crassostrea virginica TaxID=6565 RepID=A0A8B8BE21_CRAVI|nr:scavenger receptor class F member 2-like [Crassostrea virginica]